MSIRFSYITTFAIFTVLRELTDPLFMMEFNDLLLERNLLYFAVLRSKRVPEQPIGSQSKTISALRMTCNVLLAPNVTK